MIKSILTICLLLCCLSVTAVDKEKVLRAKSKVDSILDVHTKIKVDTNYISRPVTNWTLKLRVRGYGSHLSIKGDISEMGEVESIMKSPLKTTIGVSANYRGLALSVSVNPKSIFGGGSSGHSSTLLLNSNMYGGELSYSITDDVTATTTINGHTVEEKMNSANMSQVSMSGYYVFNGKKFSYPAAFSHSWIQRRSAGSIVAWLGLYGGILESSVYQEDVPLIKTKIRMTQLSLGCGYGYNFVPNKRWLLHLSVVPHIILLHKYSKSLISYQSYLSSEKRRLDDDRPGFGSVGRLSATYNWQNYFIGLCGVVQTASVSVSNNNVRIGDTQWRGELLWGVRL